MRQRSPDPGPSSLLRTTVRRSLALGRLYIIVGVIYVSVLAYAVSLAGGSSFTSSFPIFLPIFAVVGSMGTMMVFSNDRTKGVFEYLIAYGVSPRRLFVNILLASLLLVTFVLALLLGLGLGIYVASGNAITLTLLAALGVYAVPMSYASASFAAIVGMIWTSLSAPRSGINSPVGLMPFIGIAPSLLTLGLVAVLATEGFTDVDLVIGAAVGTLVVAVLVLVALLDRLLPNERLLSPV
jgi:hypothetical protein